jgi:hypothetical protein
MPRKRQEQQTMGADYDPPKHPEVEDAAETYVAVRDERMDLALKEREAKKELIAVMQRHGVTTYKYRDGEGAPRTVVAETKVNAKVSKDRKAKDDEGFPVEDSGDDQAS